MIPAGSESLCSGVGGRSGSLIHTCDTTNGTDLSAIPIFQSPLEHVTLLAYLLTYPLPKRFYTYSLGENGERSSSLGRRLLLSMLFPFFPAILVIEFVYAIVGIVWLTQYYTSCNDITAKSVTLGTELECGLGAFRCIGGHPSFLPVPIDSGKWMGAVNVGLVFLFIARNSPSIHLPVLRALRQGPVFPGKGSLEILLFPFRMASLFSWKPFPILLVGDDVNGAVPDTQGPFNGPIKQPEDSSSCGLKAFPEDFLLLREFGSKGWTT